MADPSRQADVTATVPVWIAWIFTVVGSFRALGDFAGGGSSGAKPRGKLEIGTQGGISGSNARSA